MEEGLFVIHEQYTGFNLVVMKCLPNSENDIKMMINMTVNPPRSYKHHSHTLIIFIISILHICRSYECRSYVSLGLMLV